MACRKCGYNAGPRIEMDEFYGCPRVNGILFPQPINYMPLAPPLHDEVAFQHQELDLPSANIGLPSANSLPIGHHMGLPSANICLYNALNEPILAGFQDDTMAKRGSRRGRRGGRGGGRGDDPLNDEGYRQRNLRDVENDDVRREIRVLRRRLAQFDVPGDGDSESVPTEEEEDVDNPFTMMGGEREIRHRATDPLRNFGVRLDIPDFSGKALPDEFIDWFNTIERVFDIQSLSEKNKVNDGPNIFSELADLNKTRKKRRLISSQVTQRKAFSLKLHRCEEDNDFILVMHEVATGISTFFILLHCEKSGKIKMEAKEIFIGHRVVSLSSPITEEIYPHMPNKCNLTMLERLDGPWTVEIRERAGNAKTEKFYYHEKVNKTFRSLNDVATFIVYSVIY
ncbi:hypothetical protein CASFOL_031323 [Castilleja foliolosa]|uniref:Uncharacterized protein n=1 Tax=Castilleja foliolosa TaxID=1961234 RepID=A0ABD3C753_9LAMI